MRPLKKTSTRKVPENVFFVTNLPEHRVIIYFSILGRLFLIICGDFLLFPFFFIQQPHDLVQIARKESYGSLYFHAANSII